MPARDFATVMKEWPSVKPATFTRTSTNHLEVARQFKHYEKRFDTVFKILKLTEGDDDETKVSLWTLHEYDLVTKATEAIDDTQVSTVSGVYKKFIKKLNLYFCTDTLEEYARAKLTNLSQKENQSAADFLVVIKQLIQDAGWTDASIAADLTKTKLLQGLRSEIVRQQYRFSTLPGKTEFTVADIVEVANVISQSERGQTGNQRLYTSDQVVQAVRQWQPQRYRAQRNQNQNRRNPKKNQNQNRACYGCGSRSHRSNRDPKCPARDASCHKCQKKGHFKKYCMSGGNSRKKFTYNKYNNNNKKFNQKKNWVKKVEQGSRDPSESASAPNSDQNTDSIASLQATLANQVFF